MSNLTNVRLVPPSTAQSQNPRPGVRPVPLSPSSTAESGPTGDKFGDSLPIEATDRQLGGSYTQCMSVVSHSDEPTGLTVVVPDEALKRAQPLPSDEDTAITDLTDDEWKAFQKALADR